MASLKGKLLRLLRGREKPCWRTGGLWYERQVWGSRRRLCLVQAAHSRYWDWCCPVTPCTGLGAHYNGGLRRH